MQTKECICTILNQNMDIENVSAIRKSTNYIIKNSFYTYVNDIWIWFSFHIICYDRTMQYYNNYAVLYSFFQTEKHH
jgi:hypothetical protein